MKNSLMKKKKTSSSPYKENNPPINVRNSLNHQRTVKTSNLSEISPNLPYSSKIELKKSS